MEEVLKNNVQDTNKYGGKKKKRLIDYFAVFERDIEGKVTCVSFPTKRNDSNHSEFPGAHVVGMFCFPLIRQCKEKELNSFVLTSTDYSHTYGAVLRFPIKNNVNKYTDNNNNNTDDKNGEQALCILSHYPFFKLFEGILKTMYEIFLNNTKETLQSIPPLERYLTYLIYEIPVPSRGEQLTLTLSPLIPSLYQTRFPIKNMPEVDCGTFHLLFQYLSAENVVHVVEAILMEQRIVLMSENIRILAPIGEALLALIFPLQWQLIYIPMLPSYMTLSLKSPVNYIVGVHTSNVIDSEEDLELPAAVVVHLDQNKVINPLICEVMITADEIVDDIPKFPVKLREKLINNLNQILPTCIMEKQKDEVTNDDVDQMSTMLQWTSRVQACFLNVFLKLLSSYTRYNKTTSPTNNHGPGNNTVTFDSNGFLRSRMYLWRRFLSAMIQTQAFQEFLQAASRGDPQTNEFDRYLVLDKANIHQGKSSNDIHKMLFVPIVDRTKNISLKCTAVDNTPVIGSDMRKKFIARRQAIIEKGRFPTPDESMAFPPRSDFQVTRLLEGKEIGHFRDGNNNIIDESPMIHVNTSQHKRGRHTREVSRLIVQKSLMRVESIDSANSGSRGGSLSSNGDLTLILSPSTHKKGNVDNDDGVFARLSSRNGNGTNELKVKISPTSSDFTNNNVNADSLGARKERMQQQKLLYETLSKPRHRRLATTPSQFTPGAFNQSKKHSDRSPSPSLVSSQAFKPSPLRRTASSHMMSNKSNTTPELINPEQSLYVSSGSKLNGSSSKGGERSNNSLLSHFDAVRKALAKSRSRAERAEATAELSTSKLKEVHTRMVELQRLLLNQNNNDKLTEKQHWKLAAAMNKIEKLENKISSQEHKISLLQAELKQNAEFQTHLIDKIDKHGSSKQHPTKRRSSVSTTSTSQGWGSNNNSKMKTRQNMKIRSMNFKQKSSRNLLERIGNKGLNPKLSNASKSTPNMKINSSIDDNAPEEKKINGRRRSSLAVDIVDSSRYKNQYKLSSRKNAEMRVLKEKVEQLQVTLERMRRLAKSRKRRSEVLNHLKSNKFRTKDSVKERIIYIQKSLTHENDDVAQRLKDLDSIKSVLSSEQMEHYGAGGFEEDNLRSKKHQRRSVRSTLSHSNFIEKDQILSFQSGMEQIKEDMEFQLDALLRINHEIQKTVLHAKKKAKEFPIKVTQHSQKQKIQHHQQILEEEKRKKKGRQHNYNVIKRKKHQFNAKSLSPQAVA
jgi:hypothetical protein